MPVQEIAGLHVRRDLIRRDLVIDGLPRGCRQRQDRGEGGKDERERAGGQDRASPRGHPRSPGIVDAVGAAGAACSPRSRAAGDSATTAIQSGIATSGRMRQSVPKLVTT